MSVCVSDHTYRFLRSESTAAHGEGGEGVVKGLGGLSVCVFVENYEICWVNCVLFLSSLLWTDLQFYFTVLLNAVYCIRFTYFILFVL